MLGSFRQYSFESHGSHRAPDIVGIYQGRIAEYFRRLAEKFLDLAWHSQSLLPETFLIGQGRQAVGIRFRQELHTPRFVQFLQQLYHRRCIILQQLNGATWNGKSHFEETGILLNHLEEGLKSRQIGMLDRIGNTALVLIVIVIIMVRTDIEEAITFQMYILMNFEIKAYRFHVLGF